MKRLAIITTHPIQYNAPWFALLNERQKINVKVFYTWGQLEDHQKFDPDFGKIIKWDIPLLQGYHYVFVKNISKHPGSHHFAGVDNPTLIQEIEDWSPNAVLVIGWNFKSHLKVLRHFKGKKTVLFRGDSNLVDDSRGISFRKLSRQIFLKWVYKHIDFALYVGDANRIYFKKMGLTERQLIYSPHAIDNKRFSCGKDLFRSKLAIPEEATVFLFCGKLEVKKNPELLLAAFIKLNDSRAHLVFAGDGVLMKYLQDSVKELGAAVQKRIHFVGFQNQSEMPSIYASADVFVLPSRGPGETWGLTVNEAMAAGLAVIVSDKCGCCSDLVKNGKNGFCFESENIAHLTSLMKQMLEDKNALKEMGKTSTTVINRNTFENICEVIEEVLIDKT